MGRVLGLEQAVVFLTGLLSSRNYSGAEGATTFKNLLAYPGLVSIFPCGWVFQRQLFSRCQCGILDGGPVLTVKVCTFPFFFLAWR